MCTETRAHAAAPVRLGAQHHVYSVEMVARHTGPGWGQTVYIGARAVGPIVEDESVFVSHPCIYAVVCQCEDGTGVSHFLELRGSVRVRGAPSLRETIAGGTFAQMHCGVRFADTAMDCQGREITDLYALNVFGIAASVVV